MLGCPVCGEPRPNRHDRGPLLAQLNPPGAWFHGKPIDLSPRQLAVLDLLCRYGKASHLAVQMVGTSEDALPKTAAVMLTMLRRRLPPGLSISSIFGWGYELVIEHHPEGD